MPFYVVECHGEVRELYTVEAASEEEALANWTDGHLELTEASTSPVRVTLDED